MATAVKTRTEDELSGKTYPNLSAELGPINIASWEKEHTFETGTKKIFDNIKLERSWKDKNGDYQSMEFYLDGRDLANTIALLQAILQENLKRQMRSK